MLTPLLSAALLLGSMPTEWHALTRDGSEAELSYRLLTPFTPHPGPVPLLLVLPPGDQDRDAVDLCVDRYFAEYPRKAGWAIACPQRPSDAGQNPADYTAWLDPLLTSIAGELERELSVVHLVGVSNGGVGAFGLVDAGPDRFASLTVMPGYLAPDQPEDRLARIGSLPVNLIVGENDERLLPENRRMEQELLARGARSLDLQVLPKVGHMLPVGRAKWLFQQINRHETQRRKVVGLTREAGRVLDLLHRAAAVADEDTYFDLFTPRAVFIGTDAGERWTLDEFRRYAMPHFQKETAWTFQPYERVLEVDPSLRLAWFDEKLSNAKYGDTRGSGVLQRVGDRWRIAQYVLSFAVPNEKAGDVVDVIRGPGETK